LLGLYIHVPFCASICNYCNFTRGLIDDRLKARFVDAVLQEVRRAPSVLAGGAGAGVEWSADTLYFGGGTPSLLTPDEVRSIVETVRCTFHLAADAEVTLEANPESVDAASLEGFRAAGVNRLSFGVQSFRDEELQRLGRLHSGDRAAQVVALARSVGFDNISLDLMMSLPLQDVAQWLWSIGRAVQINPSHLSLYILEVYPHLPLKREIDLHGWLQPSDEKAAEMYESAMDALEAAGYEQYEISNVAKPGRQSRHNLKYWSDGEWWGFGPGAHSTWRGSRWRNVSETFDYVQRIAAGASVVAERRILSVEERLGDALFTGLRLTAGIDLARLSILFGTDVWGRYGEQLAPFQEAGLIQEDGSKLRLTRQGMLLANEVMAVFV
jgi:oxygen-independent coproporphyrinogen-3 oxidase